MESGCLKIYMFIHQLFVLGEGMFFILISQFSTFRLNRKNSFLVNSDATIEEGLNLYEVSYPNRTAWVDHFINSTNYINL